MTRRRASVRMPGRLADAVRVVRNVVGDVRAGLPDGHSDHARSDGHQVELLVEGLARDPRPRDDVGDCDRGEALAGALVGDRVEHPLAL